MRDGVSPGSVRDLLGRRSKRHGRRRGSLGDMRLYYRSCCRKRQIEESNPTYVNGRTDSDSDNRAERHQRVAGCG